MLKKFMSTKMTVILKLLVAGSIIAYLIGSGQLSFSKILYALKPVNIMVIACLYFVTTIITSLRWNLLLRMFHFRYRPWDTLKLSLIGSFFNTFMPGAVGGDLIKTYYIYAEEKDKKSKILASFSVFLDRFVGLLSLIFLVTFLFLFFWDSIVVNTYYLKLFWLVLSVSLAAAMGLFFLWFLSKQDLENKNYKILSYKYVLKFTHFISQLRGRWHYIFMAFVMTFCSQTLLIFIFYSAALDLGFYEVPMKIFFLAVPLALLVTALPLTPAGVGTGQMAFLIMFRWLGVPERFSGADLCTFVQIILAATSLISGSWFYIKYKRGSIKSTLSETPELA